MKFGSWPLSRATLGNVTLRVALILLKPPTGSSDLFKNSLRLLAMALRIGPLNKVATASKTGPERKTKRKKS